MIEMLTQPFFQHALAASILIALLCSFLGVYIVLRRIVFLGLALAQISSAGVALAGLLGIPAAPLSMALTVGGAACFARGTGERRLPLEGVVGAVYALAAALAVLVVALQPGGEARVLNILFGNILAVSTPDVLLLLAVAVLVGAVHFFYHKEFLYVSFDAETARALGVRSGLWNVILFLTLGAAIGACIRCAGPLLTFTMLVLPPLSARLLTRRMRSLFILSMVCGAAGALIGLFAAAAWNLPATSAMVAGAGAVLLLAALTRLIQTLRDR